MGSIEAYVLAWAASGGCATPLSVVGEETANMTTIGILGSGHVGSSLARAAIAHGYDVVISNLQGPDTLTGLVQDLGPRAATAAGAAAAGDFAIVV
jgi:prephenate dehydrogenase